MTLSVLAREPFPSCLTARPDGLSNSRPRHVIFPQQIDSALQLVFRLLQPGRVDAKLIEQHLRHLAIGPNREFTVLSLRLKNLIAKLHTLVADEDARTGDELANLVLALAAKGAAE